MARGRLLFIALASVALAALPAAAQPRDERVARARQLFTEGQQAFDAGRLNEALERLLESYRLVRSPELAFNVGRVYERMGDADNGIRYFRLYLRTGQPNETDRTDVERRVAALEALKRRQREQIFAAPASRDELTAEARVFFERGVAMYRRRQYEAALRAFTDAYNFARLPEVIYNIAITSERLGNTQDAIDYYREYLRARTTNAADRAAVEAKIAALRRTTRR